MHSKVSQFQWELNRMNILLWLVLSGQVPSLQSKNWIGNLLKMNYFEFSFRENEISASKVCMATAGWVGWSAAHKGGWSEEEVLPSDVLIFFQRYLFSKVKIKDSTQSSSGLMVGNIFWQGFYYLLFSSQCTLNNSRIVLSQQFSRHWALSCLLFHREMMDQQ